MYDMNKVRKSIFNILDACMPPNDSPSELEIIRFKNVENGYVVVFSYYWPWKGKLIGTAHMNESHQPVDFDTGLKEDNK